MTKDVIDVVNAMGAAQGMHGLKIETKTGQVLWNSAWIAGVDYAATQENSQEPIFEPDQDELECGDEEEEDEAADEEDEEADQQDEIDPNDIDPDDEEPIQADDEQDGEAEDDEDDVPDLMPANSDS